MIDEDVFAELDLLCLSRNYFNIGYLTRAPRLHFSFLQFACIPISATNSRKRVIDWTLLEESAKVEITCDISIFVFRVLSLYYKIVLQKYLDFSHTCMLKCVMARRFLFSFSSFLLALDFTRSCYRLSRCDEHERDKR